MSHELRTPLNSTLILAKLLADNREGNLNAEQIKFAETIYSAGNDLLTLINDILDLSKIEAGRLDVRPEEVPVARLRDELVDVLRAARARQGDPADAPPWNRTCAPAIFTDPTRLQQVLKNLLSNACKFTERGGVALRVRKADGDRIAFDVKDTGLGIAPDQHEVIFEAFRQADGTTNRKYGGTGLGLSISRDLARLLGGDLTLDSAPGRGSTFTLTLPRTDRRAGAAAARGDGQRRPPETNRRARAGGGGRSAAGDRRHQRQGGAATGAGGRATHPDHRRRSQLRDGHPGAGARDGLSDAARHQRRRGAGAGGAAPAERHRSGRRAARPVGVVGAGCAEASVDDPAHPRPHGVGVGLHAHRAGDGRRRLRRSSRSGARSWSTRSSGWSRSSRSGCGASWSSRTTRSRGTAPAACWRGATSKRWPSDRRPMRWRAWARRRSTAWCWT